MPTRKATLVAVVRRVLQAAVLDDGAEREVIVAALFSWVLSLVFSPQGVSLEKKLGKDAIMFLNRKNGILSALGNLLHGRSPASSATTSTPSIPASPSPSSQSAHPIISAIVTMLPEAVTEVQQVLAANGVSSSTLTTFSTIEAMLQNLAQAAEQSSAANNSSPPAAANSTQTSPAQPTATPASSGS